MTSQLKKLVSKKKRRFQEDGVDLDMTFITKRIVAMGFPAEALEGVYRNNMKDVKKFFDRRYRDHYKVYNLCSERDYDAQKFYGRVAKYPFDDHNAPPFQLMEPFCKDVQDYLAVDERNVAVIHCKAGKGRTGVMICAYLLHCRQWERTESKDKKTGEVNAEEALSFYGHARTTNGKGVTIPSQIRYVKYYGEFIRRGAEYQSTTLIMTHILLKGIPRFKDNGCTPSFTIRQLSSGKNGPDKVIIFKSGIYDPIDGKAQSEVKLKLKAPTPVCGDIKVEFVHKTGLGKEKMFHLWFNTMFVHDLKFTASKPCIDKANKDKKHQKFPETFAVQINFESPRGGASAAREASPAAPGHGAKLAASAQGKVPTMDPGLRMPAARSASASAMAAGGDAKPVMRARESCSNLSQDPEWSDSDLTDDEEEDDEDEWVGLPISDV